MINRDLNVRPAISKPAARACITVDISYESFSSWICNDFSTERTQRETGSRRREAVGRRLAAGEQGSSDWLIVDAGDAKATISLCPTSCLLPPPPASCILP